MHQNTLAIICILNLKNNEFKHEVVDEITDFTWENEKARIIDKWLYHEIKDKLKIFWYWYCV